LLNTKLNSKRLIEIRTVVAGWSDEPQKLAWEFIIPGWLN